MKTWRLTLAVAALLVGGHATAQVRPSAGAGDPRLQAVAYQPDQVVLIEAALGYSVTVELAPDESIETAALGDSAAWQVSASRAGNRLFIKPLSSGNATNLTVVTSVRTYNFELSSSEGSSAPYTVRFDFPPQGESFVRAPRQPLGQRREYKVKGARALRPTAMSDDGLHTYIEWPVDTSLPATYLIDDNGREALANGSMRGDIYVLDEVAERVIFRIDRKTASATRQRPRR